MDLLTYLNEHFYTKQTLLTQCKIDEIQFDKLQQAQVMPKASYQLELAVSCDSFFGNHIKTEHSEYFAKGYVSWIKQVSKTASEKEAFLLFSNRYKAQLSHLQELGHSTNSAKLVEQLDEHIKSEWQHFLAGTYGLCTESGLPEDIASKELAIAEIEQLIANDTLNDDELKQLTQAVNLLDKASALFAPHERSQSSRQRLINEVRQKYEL